MHVDVLKCGVLWPETNHCQRVKLRYLWAAELILSHAKQSKAKAKAKEVFRQGRRPLFLCLPNYIEHNLYKMYIVNQSY